MTRVVRNAALLCAGGILLASAAVANVPDPAKCTLGSNYAANDNKRGYIPVVGFHNAPADSIPDDAGAEAAALQFVADYEVTVRDNGGVAIVNASVCIDFSGCPDMQLSQFQLPTKSPNYATSAGGGPNGSAQVLVGCSTICGSTNAAGKYMFKIIGRARNTGAPGAYPTGGGVKSEPGTQVSYEGVTALRAQPLASDGCAQVSANLTPLKLVQSGPSSGFNPRVWLVDVAGLDATAGDQGVDGGDLSQLIVEKNHTATSPAAKSRARSDYSRDGLVDGADVSRMINFVTVAAASGSKTTRNRATGFCP